MTISALCKPVLTICRLQLEKSLMENSSFVEKIKQLETRIKQVEVRFVLLICYNYSLTSPGREPWHKASV